MELKIYNPTDDGFVKSIEWNHEEIKAEVKEKISFYNNLVYTEDQIKEAKADRAKLNKFITALEDKRKAIKKQCLAPYEAFETEMKEIINLVKEPVNLIDVQISDYEKKKKEEKREKIESFIADVELSNAEKLHGIKIPFVDKWLNASVSMKSIEDDVNAFVEKAVIDLNTLANLPEFGFEATEVYKSTLDMNKAIYEAQNMARIAKAKAEAEAKKAEYERTQAAKLAEQMAVEEQTTVSKMEQVEPQPTQKKNWVRLAAFMTRDQAYELKKFFDDRCIEFKAI